MRRGMRLAGRNPEAPTSDGAPNIKRSCDGTYRAPGLARKTGQERHVRFDGDMSDNGKPERFNRAVGDREKTRGQ